jgi:hypothetical protein
MEIKLDLPTDIFDDNFKAQDFATRLRELAILELLRAKRLHEHEAQRMLGVERWELVELMERYGITPTEKLFEEISSELRRAIAGRKRASDSYTGDKENGA